MSEALDHSVDTTELWPRYTSFERGAISSVSGSLGWRQIQNSPQRQDRIRFATCHTGTQKCPRTHGENDKNVWMLLLPSLVRDRKEDFFRVLDILTVEWATGGVPEECRFLLFSQLMFLKKETAPTTEIFDDDECIRSLTEAQEIAADISEDRFNHDQSEADP